MRGVLDAKKEENQEKEKGCKKEKAANLRGLLMKLFFIVLVSTLLVLAGCAANKEKYIALEKCLLEKGVKMYGIEWCPTCAKQKKNFGSKLEGIYVECADNPQLCLEKEVKGYPTWHIGEEKYQGLLQPEELATKAGCKCDCKETCVCEND